MKTMMMMICKDPVCPCGHSTNHRMVRDMMMMTAVKDVKNEDCDDDDLYRSGMFMQPQHAYSTYRGAKGKR